MGNILYDWQAVPPVHAEALNDTIDLFGEGVGMATGVSAEVLGLEGYSESLAEGLSEATDATADALGDLFGVC